MVLETESDLGGWGWGSSPYFNALDGASNVSDPKFVFVLCVNVKGRLSFWK